MKDYHKDLIDRITFCFYHLMNHDIPAQKIKYYVNASLSKTNLDFFKYFLNEKCDNDNLLVKYAYNLACIISTKEGRE